MPKFLLIISFMVAGSFCFAQKHNDYFVKNSGEYVENIDSADFIRIVSEPDSGSKLYNVFELYKNNKRKLVGKSSRIDPPRYEGQVVTYFENGRKNIICNYVDGRVIGSEYKYYPNGKLYMVIQYPDSANIKKSIPYAHPINECYDSLGIVLVNHGNGFIKIYDDDFKYIYEQGKTKNGKRDSVWNGTDKKLGINFTEIYKEDELISGTGVDDKGIAMPYEKSRETIPLFNKNKEAFFKYLAKNVNYPSDAMEKGIQGKVIIKFVVTKLGKITNVTIVKSAGKSLDEEAIRVIKNSRDWIPGTKFGHVTDSDFTIPLSFTLADRNR